MKRSLFVTLSVLIGVCFADVSLNKGVGAPSPPYAPSGTRPQGARLNPPSARYGAPVPQQRHASEIEVTKENVEFSQQVVEVSTDPPAPKNAYLPPPSPAGATKQALVC